MAHAELEGDRAAHRLALDVRVVVAQRLDEVRERVGLQLGPVLLVPSVLLAEAVEQGVDRVDVEAVVGQVVEAAGVGLRVTADAVDQDQGLATCVAALDHAVVRVLALDDASLGAQQLYCDRLPLVERLGLGHVLELQHLRHAMTVRPFAVSRSPCCSPELNREVPSPACRLSRSQVS